MDEMNFPPPDMRQTALEVPNEPAPQFAGGRPLRIAIVHAADRGGGAERSVLTLHKTLLELGHHSRLWVGEKRGDDPEVYEIARERSIPGMLRLTRWLEDGVGLQALYAPWFRSLHKQLGSDVDVVHIHSLWNMRQGFADLSGVVRLARRYPTVMTLRDCWMLTGHCACYYGCQRWKTGCGKCPDLAIPPAVPRDTTGINWRRKRRAIQRSPVRVTAVSNWLKDQVAQSPIFAGKPIDVVHNSIDETSFFPGSQQEARAALGVPQDAFVVLLAGQGLEGARQGRPRPAVEALNRLSEFGITALLVGRSAANVAAMIDTPRVAVPFQESPAAMAQCYRAADLTIVPSEVETFGRVAAESLCCGTPVVAFATGGLTDIVKPGTSGWLVPTGDIEALAKAIQQVFQNRGELNQIRRTCAPWAATQFATQEIAEQYVRVYREAIAERMVRTQ
jgi:glycosyltransferase involved in cell wall biosynthesis